MTPRELQNCFDGYMKLKEREFDTMITNGSIIRSAYHSKKFRPKQFKNPYKKTEFKFGDTAEIKERLKKKKRKWAEFDKQIASGERVFKELKPRGKR